MLAGPWTPSFIALSLMPITAIGAGIQMAKPLYKGFSHYCQDKYDKAGLGNHVFSVSAFLGNAFVSVISFVYFLT
jgi:hypothetical protein